MKKMKKLITLLLTVLLLLNFASCGKIKNKEIVGSWKLKYFQSRRNDKLLYNPSPKEFEERLNKNPADLMFKFFRILFNSDKTYIIENALGDTMDEGTWSIVNSTDIELVSKQDKVSEIYILEEDGLLTNIEVIDYTDDEIFSLLGKNEITRTFSKEN